MRWPVGRLCEPRIRYEKGTVPHLETFRLVSATQEKPEHSHEFARPSFQALSTSVGRYIEHRLVGAVGTSRFCRRRRERGVPQRSGYDARTRWWGKVRGGVYRPVLTSRWISCLTWSMFEHLSAVRTGRAIAFLAPPCDRDTNCACPRLTSLVGIHLLLKLRQSHTSATERDLARRLSCTFADALLHKPASDLPLKDPLLRTTTTCRL